MSDVFDVMLNELGKKLKETMDQFRLTPCFGAFNTIHFLTEDEKASYCPVSLTYDETSMSHGVWKGCLLEAEAIQNVKLGRTGWTWQTSCGDAPEHVCGQDFDAFCRRIESYIRKYPIVYHATDIPKFTTDDDFGSAYFAVKERMSFERGARVSLQRDEEGDSILLKRSGFMPLTIRVGFKELKLSMGGEVVATFPTNNLDGFGNYFVLQHADDQDRLKGRGRYFFQ